MLINVNNVEIKEDKILIEQEGKQNENNNDQNKVISILDQGKVPSLRKIDYDEEILKYLPNLNNIHTGVSPFNNQILNFNDTQNCSVLSDHDIFYLMKSIQTINGIATLKILPYGYSDFKNLNSNKIKIIPLPLKDINYEELPLTTNINELVLEFKRKNLMEMDNFKSIRDKNEVSNMKIDVLFDNDDLACFFNLNKSVNITNYKFPHRLYLYNQNNFTFNNVKNQILSSINELNINNQSGYGMIFLLTLKYLFIAPLVKPYFIYNKEYSLFADPLFYAGIFSLPNVESEWSETIERNFVKFDLMKILEDSSNYDPK